MISEGLDTSNDNEELVSARSFVSDASSHFPSNLKLTPVKASGRLTADQDELQRTIERAREGKTLAQEFIDADTVIGDYNNINKNDSGRANWNFSSTPTKYGTKSNNIFNPQQSPSKLDENPVRGAFNLFDKNPNHSFVSISSIGSSGKPIRKLRKRMRAPVSDQSSLIHDFSNHSVLRGLNNFHVQENVSEDTQRGKVTTTWHSLISDRQFVANMTTIMQISLNSVVFLIMIVLSVAAFIGVKRDVDRKISKHISKLIYEINTCKRDYFINNCSPEMRVPALEQKCSEWDNCMSQDPEAVITSVAYFEVMADCMNAFFQNLSFRTICGITLTFVMCVVLPNLFFSKLRTSNTTVHKTYVNNTNPTPTNDVKLIEPTNGTVRFNPNISYSFYDDDDHDDDNNDN